MDKKNYIIPECKEIELRMKSSMLIGSGGPLGADLDDPEILSRSSIQGMPGRTYENQSSKSIWDGFSYSEPW